MSSRIQRLPQEIAEKIAAGEVVERPFSVVKELVENSLDAGAKRIEVFIEEGGRKLIRVQDDGIGMNPEEMRLALERHATSKIGSLDDLFKISTLGFRGEAVPSLASVSRFTMRSRPSEGTMISGYEISLEGGKILQQNEVGHPVGTTIEVKDLFYNTPARLKFLKTNETEWGHIEDYLTGMALAYPDVQFVASHNGKQKIRWLARGAKPRLVEIFGAEVSEGLYPLSEERPELSLKGFIGHPNLSRSQNASMYFFLNRRLIKDRLLNHAIMAGYRNLLMKDQYPFVVLSLEIEPHLVDVNVHPTKREVRFVQPNVIHQFVSLAIGKHLSLAPWAKVEGDGRSPSPWPSPVQGEGNTKDYFSSVQSISSPSPMAGEGGGEGANRKYLFSQVSSDTSDAPQTWYSSNYQKIEEGTPFTKVGRLPFSTLSVIGQLKGTYILCQTEEHFVILDQHAAHERIGFEKLRSAYKAGKVPVQQLLVPQIIELKEVEREALHPHLGVLESFGLILEEFGPTSIAVKGTPAVLGAFNVESLVKELVEDLKTHGSSTRLEDRLDELFALMACHRQIRAGDALTHREMQELVAELDEGAYSYHCPHGRPVMVQITFREIEKWFKRIV
ncbi:MAG: DNA mismatch repair endonuclease MutL [bacterium]